MREIKYLSPSSLAQWESNPTEFYLTRLSDNRMPPFPQTQPMSIGSAVDARWKNYITGRLLGPEVIAPGGQYHLQELFDLQVDEMHRKWAWPNSDYVMQCYIDSGAMADLMLELKQGTHWQFEFTLAKTLAFVYEGEEIEVPLLGKPDCYFDNQEGCGVVYDLKVNGYCSKSKVSPSPGFINRRSLKSGKWSNSGEHKDAIVKTHKGVPININRSMDSVDAKWAAQLATYAWMYGEPIGSSFVCGIEQFACGPAKTSPMPEVEVVSHRAMVSSRFQEDLAARYAKCWKYLAEGRIFPDLSLRENDAKIKELEVALADPKEMFRLQNGGY
jgi:hypothetical protein